MWNPLLTLIDHGMRFAVSYYDSLELIRKANQGSRQDYTILMSFQTFKAALSLLRKDGFSAVAQRGSEKLASKITVDIKKSHESDSPEWLSNVKLCSFCVGDSEYIIAQNQANQDIKLTIDTTDVCAIEIPIAGSEYSDSITIETPSEDLHIESDDSYTYPSQIWRTFNIDESISNVTVQISSNSDLDQGTFFDGISTRNAVSTGTRVGLPAVYRSESQPPVFLISIDTLPYHSCDHLQPLIDALGQHSTMPGEPRTQAHWTPPSHASMFTGSHPGDHGYVGHGKAPGDKRPINPDLTTIPELLTDHGYKCSCLVSHTRILPEFGFGRGCHRFRADTMSYSDWISRNHDSHDSISQIIEWIDADIRTRDHSLFYFLHIFDPHYPYIPPLERLEDNDLDLSKASRYREQYASARGETGNYDYLRMYKNVHDVDPDLCAEMERYHSLSVEYTAERIARFIDYLRSVDLFDKSLIIITGDHGEEFGERGFFTHTSLYDRNIRPFMTIKPPVSAEWSVPNTVDTIDFLPTIAHEIGVGIPESCAGEPLQQKLTDSEPRITERITPERYNVAVESQGTKGIFTYESGYPDRPTNEVVDSGPVLTEFYDVETVRDGNFAELEDPSNATKLERIAEEFVTSEASGSYDSTVSASRPSQETEERLKDLGYM